MTLSQRGFTPLLLIVIIAVLVVGGGIYLYKQTNTNEGKSANSITLLAPNGGETLSQGYGPNLSNYINWEIDGPLNGNNYYLTGVSVDLYDSTGANLIGKISTYEFNNQTYWSGREVWQSFTKDGGDSAGITGHERISVVPGNYKIKIYVDELGISDMSDEPFLIKEKTGDDNTPPNSKPAVNNDTKISTTLPDALIVKAYSNNGINLKMNLGIYKGDTPSGGTIDLSQIVKGDVNSDGYEDAIILENFCGASCGQGLTVAVNQKNNTVKLVPVQAMTIKTGGANADNIKTISIGAHGTIMINFDKRDMSDPNGATFRNVTHPYMFENNSLVFMYTQ